MPSNWITNESLSAPPKYSGSAGISNLPQPYATPSQHVGGDLSNPRECNLAVVGVIHSKCFFDGVDDRDELRYGWAETRHLDELPLEEAVHNSRSCLWPRMNQTRACSAYKQPVSTGESSAESCAARSGGGARVGFHSPRSRVDPQSLGPAYSRSKKTPASRRCPLES